MGTRNLTLVKKNGEYKVAQYGQWDGYPADQGLTVLNFLKTWNRESFEQNLEGCRFLDPEKDKEYLEQVDNTPDWHKVYPELSRDTAAVILEMIQEKPLVIPNRIKFAAYSLHCEWAYLVDLDENVLEVYRGFNKDKLSETDRFHFLNEEVDTGSVYQPIKIIKKYSFDNLPDKDTFIQELEAPEDDEEEDDGAV